MRNIRIQYNLLKNPTLSLDKLYILGYHKSARIYGIRTVCRRAPAIADRQNAAVRAEHMPLAHSENYNYKKD